MCIVHLSLEKQGASSRYNTTQAFSLWGGRQEGMDSADPSSLQTWAALLVWFRGNGNVACSIHKTTQA